MLRSLFSISILFVLLSISCELVCDMMIYSKNDCVLYMDADMEECESEENEKGETEKKENENKLFHTFNLSLHFLLENANNDWQFNIKVCTKNLSGYYLLPDIPPELA